MDRFYHRQVKRLFKPKRGVFAAWAGAILLGLLGGCNNYETKPTLPAHRYPTIPGDPTLPVYLKGTIRDLAVSGNTGDFPVSSWGVVVGLRNTGDSTCPTMVRQWIIKQMQVHYIGSHLKGYSDITPDTMLSDPHVAVVAVAAYIPPGARKGDYIDAAVQCMPGNNTTSLANGNLWRADLRINGYSDPVGAVNAYAMAQGNVFVNPTYVASESSNSPTMRDGLRSGIIPNGAKVTTDRPLHLYLRTPSWAVSRAIEQRVNQRFQTPQWQKEHVTAAAQDEGIIHLFVPYEYHGDWEHFLGLVTHLYMNSNPAFSEVKAKQLAQEALKPNAPLMDISYTWEGLGKVAIPSITPLLTDPRPDVQFAAARAAAFLDDPYGQDRLVQIASTPGHPFRINAIQMLGEISDDLQIDAQLAHLLDSDEALVRVEAYKVLVAHNSQYIYSKPVQSPLNPENEFVLDLVNSSGPPLVYCSRIGQPRIAVFGRNVNVQTPLVFSTFDSHLTISTASEKGDLVKIYYSDDSHPSATQVICGRSVAELVARLGGATNEGLRFTYGDVVAILQSMSDKKDINAPFVLQQIPQVSKHIEAAPVLVDSGRPQTQPTREAESGDSLPDLRAATQPVVGPVSQDKTSRPQ